MCSSYLVDARDTTSMTSLARLVVFEFFDSVKLKCFRQLDYFGQFRVKLV